MKGNRTDWTTTLALGLLTAVGLSSCATPPGVSPDPSHSPSQVVRYQVEALAANVGDEGIAVTFRFASPANKRMTGPLERFVRIVRAPAYSPMLNHRRAEYGEPLVLGDFATQVVTITATDGTRHDYRFDLSRQRDGRWKDCWMTDAVYVLERPAEPGLMI